MTQPEDEVMVFLSSILNLDLDKEEDGGLNEKKMKRKRKKRKMKNVDDDDDDKLFKFKRKLSEQQTMFLESKFKEDMKLDFGRKLHLASEMGLDPKQVAVWFQNKRARWKNKQMEDRYAKLKSQYQEILFQKCHLESQVLALRQQLIEAQAQVQAVYSDQVSNGSGSDGRGSTTSPNTSFSIDTPQNCQFFPIEEDQFVYNTHDEHNFLDGGGMFDWYIF